MRCVDCAMFTVRITVYDDYSVGYSFDIFTETKRNDLRPRNVTCIALVYVTNNNMPSYKLKY